MASKEASPSLEHLNQEDKEEQHTAMDRAQEEPPTAGDEAGARQDSAEESRHLRQLRGRHRAALTRSFRRAEALIADGATRPQLEGVCADIDSAYDALIETNVCLELYLDGEDERADASQYVADAHAEKQRIAEKVDAYIASISVDPQQGSTGVGHTDRADEKLLEGSKTSRVTVEPWLGAPPNAKRELHFAGVGHKGRADEKLSEASLRRPGSRTSRGSGRRPMSHVSSSTSVSRASAEAKISSRLKTLRVQQLERKQDQERRMRLQEEQLKQQEEKMKLQLRQQNEELERQRELQKAKDEAEEAKLEAQLRAEMEDDLNVDRRNDFLDEDLGEPDEGRHVPQKPEYTTGPGVQSNVHFAEPIRATSPKVATSPRLSEGQTSWIDELQPAAMTPQTSMTSAFAKSIPRLKLPTYSGKPSEWPRWSGLFRALVHDQPSLSDAERMAHLQSAVTGQAQQAISGMLYDGNLYQHALKTLRSRFGQSKDVIRVHLESIFSAEPPAEDDAASLETFQATVHCAVTILHSQGYEADLSSTENLRRTVAKLPNYLRREWAKFELKLRPRSPSLLDMDEWLQEQVQVALLCPTAETSRQSSDGNRKKIKDQPARRATHATVASTPAGRKIPCPKCDGDHKLFHCREFKALNVDERVDLVFTKRLCLRCLQIGHIARECHDSNPCGKEGCRRHHHYLLHGGGIRNAPPASRTNAAADQPAEEGDQAVGGEEVRVVTASTRVGHTAGTLLQIVPVRIHGDNGTHDTYALLDPGSETSFCNQRVLEQLKIKGERKKLCLQTVEGSGQQQTSTKVQLQLSSLDPDESQRITVPEAWSVSALNISTPHISAKQRNKWRHVQGLNIPQCDGGQVELLLGANVTEAVIQREVRTGQPGQPIAVRTAFGWTLTGVVSSLVPEDSRQVMFIKKGAARETELDAMLKDWWTTESFGTKYDKPVPQSMEDRRAQDILESTTAKLPEDRYETGLLWKEDGMTLPDSKSMAAKRLLGTEKRLKGNPDKAAAYQATIDSYLDKGHAKKLSMEEAKAYHPRRWFLPHHAVTNPNKPGKFRVVFDAAAKSYGTSLNDRLLTGPDLLRNLVGVLLRFREEPVGMVADIQEMYHQVQVIQPDRPALSFLWRDLDETKAPETYEMQVTIFGAKSSPASANFVLQKAVVDHANEFGLQKEKMESVKNSFYMDDFLRSEENEVAAKETQKSVKELLARGGFRLTKWVSNSRSVLKGIPQEELAHPELDLYESHLPAEGALGVTWDAERDTLGFRFRESSVPATKRGVLQKTASIFDPLGIAAPFVIKAKILMQKLWTKQLEWDDELEGAEREQWENWLRELPELKNINVARCLRPVTETPIARELHVFCDASEEAFGAVAYLRVTLPDKTHHCSFVMSKTRVAPLKRLSIVRLELQAAVLAVRLVDALRKEIPSQVQRVTYWSDSTVVLHYIANESRRFHTFVSNRLAEIHDLSDKGQWRHCPSRCNPADLCSRGTRVSELIDNSIWMSGPEFLQADEEQWPDRLPVQDLAQEDVEVKVESFATIAVTDPGGALPDPSKFTSWTKYKRTVAWMLRFVCNSKLKRERKRQRSIGPLTAPELMEAEKIIIKQVQVEAYGAELQALRAGQHLHKKKSALADLSPILDGDGLLRVGGRLSNAPLEEDARHPVIVPAKSEVARMIISEEHRRLMHAGVDHTMNEVRQKFWVSRGRAQVKRVIFDCAICRNRRAKPQPPRMADLPADRFDDSHPFSTIGIDYFGPLTVRRFRKTEKRYGLLVTCLATRAVHLELSYSLDTDSFLMALRRFIARRGRPKKIFSDNGTNLKGGERELRQALSQWNQEQISAELSQQHIEWHFNPPAASHMGGVWERLVGSVKRALTVVLGNQVTTDEVLETVLCEVESVINSRPLTHVTDDVKDLTALTPNHFLLGRGYRSLPPGIFSAHDMHTRKRWRYAQAVVDHLWSRWKREYLHTLIHRRKWQTNSREMAVGDLVLLAESNTPRGLWPLARVTQVMPGPDGRVRTVELATAAGGTYTRPATKVALLEAAEQPQAESA